MTNPDNVGGLPDHLIACAGALGGTLLLQGGIRLTSDHLRQAAELCRAAPAGGDVAACARKLLAEVMHADALGDLPDQVHGSTMFALAQALDSAPAGSGEVEELIDDLIQSATSRYDSGVSRLERRRAETEVATIRAALLRKLQQGAE